MRLLMSLSNLVRLCLSEWISFLLPAVPIRSRATFIELLCGCLASPEGWVTRSIVAISRPVSPGADGAALRCADPGPRRHAGAVFLGVGARLRVSPRPQSQDQPATVPARAVLGHPRGERARPWRRQPGAADSLPPGADDRQPQQARDCAGAAACTGGRGRQAGGGAVRFLVYARPSGVAFAAPTDSRARSGAHRHGTVSATGGTDDPQARAQAHLWRAAERRGGSALAGHRAVLVALWSGQFAPAGLGGGVGA